MAVLDDDFSVDGTLTEGGDGIWSPSKPAPSGAPRDLRFLYEHEWARADAAEARCEELHWAEVAARSDAGLWESRFKSCRRRLSEATEEAKQLRRAVKDTPSLQAEVVHLRKLLWQTTGPSEDGMVVSLRDEVARLREALAASEARKVATGRRTGVERSPDHTGASRSLRTENKRLNKELVRWRRATGELHEKLGRQKERAESIRETGKRLSRENLRLHREVRILGDAEARARSLSDEVFWLRHALEVSKAGKEKLKARIAKLRAAGATLSKLPFDEAAQLRNVLRRSRRQKTAIDRLCKENARLRKALKAAKAGRKAAKTRVVELRTARKTLSTSLSNMDTELRRVLRRSRRQKATMKSLSRENARLRKGLKGSRGRVATLQAQLAKLRSTRSVLSKRLYGRRSEQQDKPRSQRKRGQQRGASGHGHTQRPGLNERSEQHNPPPEACVCPRCGQPYAPNGAEVSTLVEIEVIVYRRVIHRPRLRRTCECASSPTQVSAPPVPRLFANTLYGVSVWACFLFERYAGFRTLNGVAAWLSDRGLAISPGTLGDSVHRFVPLFAPLDEAILAHQNTAALRHADETSWRVQELRGEDRSSRAWLWISVSDDAVYFRIDPSRSAEAAQKLFAEVVLHTVIACDRYSSYKKLARLLGGLVTLAFCWSHMRRDFIDCAAGQVGLTQWCQVWIERIAAVYRLNEARLKHYDPALESQTSAFDAAHSVLKEALDGLFAHARDELDALPDHAREGKALRSLLNHREGLCVFVDRPQTPLDNNKAERLIRGPAIGRRLSFGSDSEGGARFTAIMYSVVGTLSMNGIDVLRWLKAWLTACAENGRKPPDDLSPWLPWSMSEERKRELTAPG